MPRTRDSKPDDRHSEEDRRAIQRYTVLTIVLFVSLLFAFGAIRNLYPVAASTMMLGLKDSPGGQEYYVMRGETLGGETVDLPPIELTNALTGRSWSLVSAAVENKGFKIASPHPGNVSLAAAYGGVDKLPRAARLNDLLHAWGTIYNSRFPPSSGQRLKLIRLDAYRWEGGINGEYYRFVESWNALL